MREAALSHTVQPTGINPIRPLLKFFSSIWLGVILLTLLFIYSSIGSSGVPIHPNIFDPAHWMAVRQLPAFELTEFEWFNWWPFDVLIALICINIIVATLRRIPLNVINLGVWMIHAGIITLALGSVWYFGTKVEGDAPIARRRLVIEAPNAARTSLPAAVGATAAVGTGDDRYVLQVTSIDPRWELLSGEEMGQRAYKVSVSVQGKGGQFVRDLVANRPQYTQDLIRTDDPQQPMQRAIKAIGKPLVDEALKLSLEYDPQQWFYLMDSRALYLREVDQMGHPRSGWIQRPISSGASGLPRYNDHIASADDIWTHAGDSLPPLRPIDVAVPSSDPNDPMHGMTLRVNRFLRYATLETRHQIDPTGEINPRVSVTLIAPSGGQQETYTLAAFDPQSSTQLQGNLAFTWAATDADLQRLKSRTEASIRFSFPNADGSPPRVVEETIGATLASTPDLPFKTIEGTAYSYRVENLQDGLSIGGRTVSLAIVQIKNGDRTFTRWIFDDSALNRDMAMATDPAQHNAMIEKDASIESAYMPGSFPPAPIVIVAGPGENDLAVVVTKATGQPVFTSAAVNQSVEIINGVTLRIDQYSPRTSTMQRPLIMPREQRDRQIGELMSMICVSLPSGMGDVWLPFNFYAFESDEEAMALRRFPYRPTTVSLADGRRVEMLFSRARMPLPAPVALDDFLMDTHVGGFTGSTLSIMDWKSQVRFRGDDGAWLQPQMVHVNNPSEFRGYWFFQAQWDPPEGGGRMGGSAGLNYTVLGVGNRNGVHVMLAGCVIAVLGMMYAFYAKPLIKRRRQQAVYAQVRENALEQSPAHTMPPVDAPQPEPVGAALEIQP